MADDFQKQLFSSLVSDIKNYHGRDPLRPWLHGIRRMKESLPPRMLKEKLPRFLQKCAQTFESDRRYRNDARYLRVWIELMDFIDDAKVLLRKMEKNGIGLKRAMFYLAYALYYEKQKKFTEAEKMYHVGVQNLAEPAGELQKSYEQFLRRMELYKKRKAKEVVSNKRCLTSKGTHMSKASITDQEGITEKKERVDDKVQIVDAEDTSHKPHHIEGSSKPRCKIQGSAALGRSSKHRDYPDVDWEKQIPHDTNDTVVVKFVDSAIVGRSEAEDACHHGLVDPTINMKEAMNAIGSMFREPIEPEIMVKRRSSKPKAIPQTNGFEVFIDDDFGDGPNFGSCPTRNEQCGVSDLPNLQSNKHGEALFSEALENQRKTEVQKPFLGEFKILADDDEVDEVNDRQIEVAKPPIPNAPICRKQHDPASSSYGNSKMIIPGLHEETIVRRFVGSTVLGEPKVENACHHGLVDPTINLKEAMDDINSMFGKPLDFFNGDKPKKKPGFMCSDKKPACDGFAVSCEGFSILADDAMEDPENNAPPENFGENGDLFEPTIFTKEAMAEINEMFGKPLDF
ncbi:hypothetical protein MUK42_05379 [Musa troglodytarum]|uniref:BUB1 N-terminal domain-containing protein n=1 Tax=Musa troglodytarum TaxID=320322 RepID=A0A9E7G0B2_9LILI|nr:hypothetical protein MUK42_05379 [Musa troglodytarum]